MEADFHLDLTFEQLCSYFDGNELNELDVALDQLQGKVHIDGAEKATLLITCTKENSNG